MAIYKDVLDELMLNYKEPDNITGSYGMIRWRTIAFIHLAANRKVVIIRLSCVATNNEHDG